MLGTCLFALAVSGFLQPGWAEQLMLIWCFEISSGFVLRPSPFNCDPLPGFLQCGMKALQRACEALHHRRLKI